MGSALSVIAAGAACGPAQKERDEANQTVVAQDVHSARDVGMGTIDAPTTSPSAQVSLGTPRPDDGAAFWVFVMPMSGHLQPDVRGSSRDNVRIQEATLPGAGHAPGGMYLRPTGLEEAIGQPPNVGASRRLSEGTADWRSLLERYADWSVEVMLRIIDCESHGDESAVSPGGANVGAFQINVGHGYSYEEMTDPQRSTEIAHDIWLSQGYGAWSCW